MLLECLKVCHSWTIDAVCRFKLLLNMLQGLSLPLPNYFVLPACTSCVCVHTWRRQASEYAHTLWPSALEGHAEVRVLLHLASFSK